MNTRPIRFGTLAGRLSDPEELLAAARNAERLGYSTFLLSDHFTLPYSPLVALQAIADATTTLRLGQLVLASDFRHPAVLAKDLASLDVLSGGRVEVGIGAGWMRSDYEQAGIDFDKPSVRIERLEEAVAVLRGLFSDSPFRFSGKYFSIAGLDGTPKPLQRPGPPILIGAGGPKMLAAAARHADIIHVMASPNTDRPSPALDPDVFRASAYRQKIDHIRHVAGERFDYIELAVGLMNVTITDDPDHAADEWLGRLWGSQTQSASQLTKEEILASPLVAIGSLDQVCDRLQATSNEFGFSYFFSPPGAKPDSLAPVIERLTAT